MSEKGFLELFFEEYQFDRWVKVIDWLLWDGKFSSWTKDALTSFVVAYKKSYVIANGLYLYDKKSVVNPTHYDRKKNKTKSSIIAMVKGQGQAKDLIRHIRNGIVHRRAKLCTRNSIRYIEIIDYGKNGNQNERSGQTAYLLMPVDFLMVLYQKYNEVNN